MICGSYYSALRKRNKLIIYGGLEGTRLYTKEHKKSIEIQGEISGSNFDLYNHKDNVFIDLKQERFIKGVTCIMIDTGIFQRTDLIRGINLINGSKNVQNSEVSNIHGECVYSILTNNLKEVDKKNVFIIQALSSNNSIVDIIEALYYANSIECNIINASLSINNLFYKNIINALINSNKKYYFSVSNSSNKNTCYIEKENVYYIYDSNFKNVNYVKELNCQKISVSIKQLDKNIYNHDVVEIGKKGNSFATAQYSNMKIKGRIK